MVTVGNNMNWFQKISQINQQSPKTHYIAMTGTRGHIPNVVEVFWSLNDAVNYLGELEGLGRGKRSLLKQNLFVDIDPANIPPQLRRENFISGNEYCEIHICSCDNPLIHSDSGEIT